MKRSCETKGTWLEEEEKENQTERGKTVTDTEYRQKHRQTARKTATRRSQNKEQRNHDKGHFKIKKNKEESLTRSRTMNV